MYRACESTKYNAGSRGVPHAKIRKMGVHGCTVNCMAYIISMNIASGILQRLNYHVPNAMHLTALHVTKLYTAMQSIDVVS